MQHVRRVLIVSANIGEGHNATGRALQEHVERCWPGAKVQWVDTLDAMGSRVGPAFRWTYVTNVEHTPWLYEFFYGALWRSRWFARAAKHFVGSWAGRALRPVVEEFRPDVIVSTYPVGTAGLAWLRRRDRLAAPVGAWVSDFAPHPFWVYRDVDMTVVMHDVAAAGAAEYAPRSRIVVGSAAVASRFTPGDRSRARHRLGLPDNGFVAVVSCGSLGFGSVPTAAAELLAADPKVTVVAVCGRNEKLRAQVAAVSGDSRLVTLGWTDEVADLLAACDVLVTNAGGVTALEAFACDRPVLMYRPIAAHGRANADLMAQAGLAKVCAEPGSLTTTVRDLIAEPEQLPAMEQQVREHAGHGTPLERQLRDLAGDGAPTRHRMRGQDSIFVQIDREQTPQQLGAVLMMAPKPDGSPATADEVSVMLTAVPGGQSHLRRRGAWRPPLLVTDPRHDPMSRMSTVDITEDVAAQGEQPALDAAIAAFFEPRIDPYRHAARATLVTGLPGGWGAFLVCAHHSFCDGVAMTNALIAAARGKPWPREPAPYDDGSDAVPPKQAVRGLVTLARDGAAPRSSLNRPVRTAARRYRRADLDLPAARTVADRLGVTPFDLAFGLLAEAVHRENPDAAPEIRLTVPQSTRSTRTFRSAGNHTGAMRVTLPTGPMPLEERIAAAAQALRAQAGSAAPAAARLVLRWIGALPPWLHRPAARGAYSGRWFSMIATVIPGARSPVVLRDGSAVANVYPVLPLAPDTRYAAGFMLWLDKLTVCITSEPDGAAVAERWCADIVAEFDRLRGASCD